MLTVKEKLEMYRNKKSFIDEVGKAFENCPKASTVSFIEYELYQRRVGTDIQFLEYIVVTFFGGAISVRQVNGNSSTANFRAIGSIIDGGYYTELQEYQTLADKGYTLVQL